MNKAELKIEYLKGTGPGGQRKNKVLTACRLTHLPTGIQAYCDERTQRTSYKKALATLEGRIREALAAAKAATRKERRDKAIKNLETVRTYDYKRGTVKDHRTGKVASIKEVMQKGRIDLLR